MKKFLSVVLCLLITTSLFTGCGKEVTKVANSSASNNETTSSVQSTEKTTVETTSPDKVKLTLYCNAVAKVIPFFRFANISDRII